MASYTDNPQLLDRFNPYIQQQPVEAMASVGEHKQQLYDQGVQKIQGQLDNIAGLDVVRDVDKQYLQSKMNGLTNNLRTVAAGDFSNFQLVNSVGGMINQIGKDSNIQNAVLSARTYRKGIEDMTTLNKEGKGSPSNDWDFKNSANKWLSSTDIKSGFNSIYSPYTNYKKNALEVIKGLTKDESITDNAFAFDTKGNLVITDTLTRRKLSGIAPEKIQQALLAGLTPADFKQMEIDGRYNYSNVDDKTFITSINNSYTEKRDAFTRQKNVLEGAKMSTSSNMEKAKLNEQIASLDKTLKNISDEYNNVSATFDSGDVESAKARLHTVNFMNGFAKGFSYTQTSETIENNPYADMEMKRQVKNQDWLKFKTQLEQDDRHFKINTKLKEDELTLQGEVNLLKKKELTGYGGFPLSVKQSDLPMIALDKVVSNIENNTKKVDASDEQFIKQNGKDELWLAQQRDAWRKRPFSVDPLVAEHFTITENARRDNASDQIMVNELNKKANEKFKDIYSKIPQDAPLVNYTTEQGNVTFTPKDFVNFNSIFDKYVNVSPIDNSISFLEKEANKNLLPKQFLLYNIYKKKVTSGNYALNNNEKAVYITGEHYRNTVNTPYRETIRNINDYIGEEIKKRLTSYQGADYGIPLANETQKSTFKNFILGVTEDAESKKGGIANSPDFDTKTARKILIDPDLQANMKVVEGTEFQDPMYEVSMNSKNGSTKFQMTKEQKMSVFGNMFEPTSEIRMIRPYQEQIRKMGGYSTGSDQGTTNMENAYLSRIDFPSINIYGVSGNIVTSNGGITYSIRLNAYDPVTKIIHENIPYPSKGVLNENQLAKAMSILNDDAVYELITGKSATANDLNRVKEASKKPL